MENFPGRFQIGTINMHDMVILVGCVNMGFAMPRAVKTQVTAKVLLPVSALHWLPLSSALPWHV